MVDDDYDDDPYVEYLLLREPLILFQEADTLEEKAEEADTKLLRVHPGITGPRLVAANGVDRALPTTGFTPMTTGC